MKNTAKLQGYKKGEAILQKRNKSLLPLPLEQRKPNPKKRSRTRHVTKTKAGEHTLHIQTHTRAHTHTRTRGSTSPLSALNEAVREPIHSLDESCFNSQDNSSGTLSTAPDGLETRYGQGSTPHASNTGPRVMGFIMGVE